MQGSLTILNNCLTGREQRCGLFVDARSPVVIENNRALAHVLNDTRGVGDAGIPVTGGLFQAVVAIPGAKITAILPGTPGMVIVALQVIGSNYRVGIVVEHAATGITVRPVRWITHSNLQTGVAVFGNIKMHTLV